MRVDAHEEEKPRVTRVELYIHTYRREGKHVRNTHEGLIHTYTRRYEAERCVNLIKIRVTYAYTQIHVTRYTYRHDKYPRALTEERYYTGRKR